MIQHAARILQRFEIEPKPADRIVARYLREHRGLSSRDRRAVANCVFGVLRWRRRLEGILTMEGVKRPSREQLVEAYLEGKACDAKRFPGGPAAYWSFPDSLYDILVSERGKDDTARLMEAFNGQTTLTLRVNGLKARREDVREALMKEGVESEPTSWSPHGLVVASRVNLASLNPFNEGLIEVQDEASQLAAMAAGVREGELVFDACAGGGGKSLFFAMAMNDHGDVVAADIGARKLAALKERAARAGATCIRTVASGSDELERYRGRCDVVVVDAPCSGTGTLRRAPDLKWRCTRDQLDSFPEQQLSLLQDYVPWLRAGGRVVYITCSVLRRENQGVIEEFLRQGSYARAPRSWMSEVGITDKRFITEEGDFAVTPAIAPMDGFFASVLIQKPR